MYWFSLSTLTVVLFGLVSTIAIAAGEDDYLSAISDEVDKVEAVTEYLAKDAGASDNTDDKEYLGKKQDFEKLLEERYHGSYIFYKKLPERTQLEIYEDYRRGAEIPKLREKIIDRYIQ
jgi:hypothetical protein